MSRDELMDDRQAVEEVCRIGQQIEADAAAVEAELRRWRPMPGGGHDPECVRALREGASLEWPMRSELLHGNLARNGADAEGAKRI